jgi:hypothetical protein
MSFADERGRTHWNSIARSWDLYSSPLRPCAEDLTTFLRFANAYAQTPPDATSTVLILGVTPEIATMSWPARTVVTGVDRSPEMVKTVWPGDIPGVRQAQCDDWFALTPPARPYEIVIGDGSINILRYPGEVRRLLAKLRTLARPGALLILRSFVLPAIPESLATLIEAARTGGAGNFHAFKFRLAMALQSSPDEGVKLDEVWQSWCRLETAVDGLSNRSGWLPDVVRTIDLFRDKQVRLSFPTLDGLVATLEAEGISLLDRHMPKYEMGDRCPIVVGQI